MKNGLSDQFLRPSGAQKKKLEKTNSKFVWNSKRSKPEQSQEITKLEASHFLFQTVLQSYSNFFLNVIGIKISIHTNGKDWEPWNEPSYVKLKNIWKKKVKNTL